MDRIGPDKLTPEILKQMRVTYGHECRVCGGRLTLQDSRDMVYACSGYEDDPDASGQLRRQPGRTAADDHYGASRVYLGRVPTDPWVMALLDAFDPELRAEATAWRAIKPSVRQKVIEALEAAAGDGCDLDATNAAIDLLDWKTKDPP
jgi:hypothetical protein